MRALVIDDSRAMRRIVGSILKDLGFEVREAGDGREALDRLHKGERPAVILLDLQMPVLDGWEFRREQGRDPALAPIPVVVVSAAGAQAAPGAAAHVQKPFQPEELLDVLRGLR